MKKKHENPESDEQLIHAILAGDHDRFDVLVRRHDALVRRSIHRCVSDDSLVEEAVQETWFQSFRRLQDLVHPQRLGAWLRRIAINCALEQGQKHRRTLSLAPMDEAATAPNPSDSSWIWEFVDLMPEDMATVLTRHYRQSESYDEIAKDLGIKRSTVRGRIYCARIELKRRLGEKTCRDK